MSDKGAISEADIDALMQVSLDAATEAVRKHGLSLQAAASAYMDGYNKGHARGVSDAKAILERKFGGGE